jgi:hypothetical protein
VVFHAEAPLCRGDPRESGRPAWGQRRDRYVVGLSPMRSYYRERQSVREQSCESNWHRRRLVGKSIPNLTEDELDAWTAWYLARCWLDGRGVMLLGNSRTGSFLLPDEPNVGRKFLDKYGAEDN